MTILTKKEQDELLANVMRKVIDSVNDAFGCYIDVGEYSHKIGGSITIDGIVENLTNEETVLLEELWKEARERDQ